MRRRRRRQLEKLETQRRLWPAERWRPQQEMVDSCALVARKRANLWKRRTQPRRRQQKGRKDWASSLELILVTWLQLLSTLLLMPLNSELSWSNFEQRVKRWWRRRNSFCNRPTFCASNLHMVRKKGKHYSASLMRRSPPHPLPPPRHTQAPTGKLNATASSLFLKSGETRQSS